MASERKLEFSDVAFVEQPVDSASVGVSFLQSKCRREEVTISMEH